MKTRAKLTLAILTSLICSASAWAADSRGEPGRSSSKTNPLKNVYFGEQHLHTQDSPDAYSMGTRNTIEDAYNYAQGKAVKKNTSGEMVQKKTPYDWVAITDHAEYMGIFPQIGNPNSDLIKKHGDNEIIKMMLSGDPKQGDKGPDATFSAFDSDRPEDLGPISRVNVTPVNRFLPFLIMQISVMASCLHPEIQMASPLTRATRSCVPRWNRPQKFYRPKVNPTPTRPCHPMMNLQVLKSNIHI